MKKSALTILLIFALLPCIGCNYITNSSESDTSDALKPSDTSNAGYGSIFDHFDIEIDVEPEREQLPSYFDDFKTLSYGMTVDEVLQIMGNPQRLEFHLFSVDPYMSSIKPNQQECIVYNTYDGPTVVMFFVVRRIEGEFTTCLSQWKVYNVSEEFCEPLKDGKTGLFEKINLE